jgi:hypothetical protein
MHWRQLDDDERKLYRDTIIGSHERRVHVHLLDRDDRFVRDLTPYVLPGGEITGDTSRQPLMVLDLPMFDPTNGATFDAPAGRVPLSRRRQVQVIDARRVPGLGWVEYEVFTGPIWTWQATGHTVRLVAHDVSRMAMGDVRVRRAWTRKTRITTVIRELLTAAGATRINVPTMRPTLAKVVHVGAKPAPKKQTGKHPAKKHAPRDVRWAIDPTDTYWARAQGLARALNRHLVVEGDGRIVLRRVPLTARLTLAEGDLLVPPNLGQSDEAERPNMWVVRGRVPHVKKKRKKGAKPTTVARPRPQGSAVLPRTHEDSRESMAWNGKPVEHRRIITDDHLKSAAACAKRARELRDRALRIPQQREVVIPTVPWLRAYDIVMIKGHGAVAIRQWRYPLSGSEGMTIGSTRRVLSRGVARR